MTPTADGGEIERLRAENAALDQQIRLLVATEQRLYRTQNQLDAQLVRVRDLAAFALESGRAASSGEILARAVGLLDATFAVDLVLVLEHDPVARTVRRRIPAPAGAEAPPLPLPPSASEWLASRHEATLARGEADDLAHPASALAAAVAPEVRPVATGAALSRIAVAPLHNVGAGRPGAIVLLAARNRPPNVIRGGLSEEHLAYLQLLANHVDRAIANVELTASLRERGEQLAQSLASLERTQNELVHAQKMEAIGRLAGGVAHDFNNLLTVIMGYAGTLSVSLPNDSPHQENVRNVIAAAQRAAGLTSQLLALGRRQMQRREALDLSEMTSRTSELLRRLLGENIRLELDLDRSVSKVHVDRSQFEQVLLNLMVNARDAMPQGGRLFVSTRRARADELSECGVHTDPSGFVALVVEDEGVGMSPETLERIFEPFYTTKEGKGSGLGLAVVYGIVKQSDGHVVVRSVPGRGSRFSVLLPVTHVAAVAEPAGESPQSVAWPKRRVLVVEDEPSIRDVVATALRGAGYDVIAAEGGEGALAALAAAAPQPDLMLTDVMMPRMNGDELARRVQERWPGIRVAFMSGYSEDLMAGVEAERLGGAFIAKPFTPARLLAFVSAQLARGTA